MFCGPIILCLLNCIIETWPQYAANFLEGRVLISRAFNWLAP